MKSLTNFISRILLVSSLFLFYSCSSDSKTVELVIHISEPAEIGDSYKEYVQSFISNMGLIREDSAGSKVITLISFQGPNPENRKFEFENDKPTFSFLFGNSLKPASALEVSRPLELYSPMSNEIPSDKVKDFVNNLFDESFFHSSNGVNEPNAFSIDYFNDNWESIFDVILSKGNKVDIFINTTEPEENGEYTGYGGPDEGEEPPVSVDTRRDTHRGGNPPVRVEVGETGGSVGQGAMGNADRNCAANWRVDPTMAIDNRVLKIKFKPGQEYESINIEGTIWPRSQSEYQGESFGPITLNGDSYNLTNLGSAYGSNRNIRIIVKVKTECEDHNRHEISKTYSINADGQCNSH